MFEAKTVGGLRRILYGKVKMYTSLVDTFTGSMASDVDYEKEHGLLTFHNQLHWLAWHAVDLPVAAVAANEASRLLVVLKDAQDEDAVPEQIKREALQNVLADMKLNSRSTSASSNLVEDAKRSFWISIGEIVLAK